MSYDLNRAMMEAELARAHRCIAKAKDAADRLGADGTWLDLQLIEVELVRLAEDSLRGRKSPPITARALQHDHDRG